MFPSHDLKLLYTDTSVNLESEYEEYEWRTDRVGVLDEPEKMNDHCFVGETLISTPKGNIPIKLINPGDTVFTSKGRKKVFFRWNNGVRDVYEYSIKTDKGIFKVKCTENHKINTKKGWSEISKLQKGMTVSLFNTTMEESLSCSMDKGILTQGAKKCIGMSGSILTKEKDQKAIMSTTKMAIPTTTGPPRS